MKTWSDTDVRTSQCHGEHAQLKNKPTWTESCCYSNSIGTAEVSMRNEALTGCDVTESKVFEKALLNSVVSCTDLSSLVCHEKHLFTKTLRIDADSVFKYFFLFLDTTWIILKRFTPNCTAIGPLIDFEVQL